MLYVASTSSVVSRYRRTGITKKLYVANLRRRQMSLTAVNDRVLHTFRVLYFVVIHM